MTNLLHYDFIAEFKKQYYKDLLLVEHLQGAQIKIDKLSFPDGSSTDKANFWGYVIIKDGKKYLLSAKDETGKEIDISKAFPIRVKTTQKVAYNSDVYLWIRSWNTAVLKAEQHMEFKDLVKGLACLQHSNETHKILMWILGITAMYSRINFRICSPPGFGKDSVVDTLGNLIGGSNTIEAPTLAKLEWETQKKWLVMNEAVGISTEKLREVEQFLLATGAHKSEVTKHSRALGNGMKEYLDISNFSLSIAYNDIDNYPNVEKYFDSITKKAVQDRFPAFRFYGTLQHDFNKTLEENPSVFVKQNLDQYKKLIQSYEYYKRGYADYKFRWVQPKYPTMPSRWVTNIGRILKTLDMYCSTQEEFNSMCKELFSCINDYQRMLEFPGLYRDAVYKIAGLDPKSKEPMPELVGVPELSTLIQEVNKKQTFVEKNMVIINFINGQQTKHDSDLDTFMGDVI